MKTSSCQGPVMPPSGVNLFCYDPRRQHGMGTVFMSMCLLVCVIKTSDVIHC